jgi:ribosomal protein S18 acetylase RimI-like enzyme
VYVNDAPQEIGLMEITLDPASRQRGLGTAIIQSLLALAQHTSRTVLLYVEPDNPARRLYERAGFVKVDEQGLYMRMRWAPNTMARIS